MAKQRRTAAPVDGVPSTAAVWQHPIHPMLIPFPVAFLVGALATDLAFNATDDLFWARASLWLVGAGLVTGVLAAIFGAIDFWTIERARAHTAGWIHFIGNAVALLLALISLWIRWDDPAAAVMPWGLVLSVIIAILLAVTGWYGGELSYRHKIGVVGHGERSNRR
jgi:uncharacterized membrane protein